MWPFKDDSFLCVKLALRKTHIEYKKTFNTETVFYFYFN